MNYISGGVCKLVVPTVCFLFVIDAYGAERHYSLSQSIGYDDNAEFSINNEKSNVSHTSAANINFQEATARLGVNIDTDIQYVNHSRVGLNDGASANGSAAAQYTVLPGRWNIGVQDVARYARDYSELEFAGNEEQTNTLSYSTDFGFRLGSSSNLSLSGVRSRLENEDDSEVDEVSKNGSLTLQNSLSPLTSVNLSYTYVDTAQFFSGENVGVSRLETTTAGLSRVFTRSNLSLSAGVTSPVGSSSSQDNIDNYSISYRFEPNTRFNVQLFAQKDASNLNNDSTFATTVTDSLSENERGEFVVDWIGSAFVSLNLNLFYGESVALVDNTGRISALLQLGGADFESDTKARFHGWELITPIAVSSRLTILPTLRVETRQFESLAITRVNATDFNFVKSDGETKQFVLRVGVRYRINTNFEINGSIERRSNDENSIDITSATENGPATSTETTDIKPNGNVINLRVQYNI